MQGDKVTARIGGNLNIETLQEKETYEEQNTSTGFGISWNVNMTKTKTTGPNKESIETTTRSFAKPNIGGSFSKGNISSHYKSARDQAGIFAGIGGFDLLVGKNTDLKGALIASKAPADKNKLSTGTLSFSDLENEADYHAKDSGSTAQIKPTLRRIKETGPAPNKSTEKLKIVQGLSISPTIPTEVQGSASSTTKSAVAPGTIDIRENPTQDISALSRNTENALNELGRIFDKKKIEEQQELAAVFGEEAFRLAHNMKDDGSGRKIIVHAAIAGLMSQITGAGFTSGAVAGALNEALINSLKGLDPGTAQIVSAIIGAAAAKVAGGSAAAGASAAASGTKWNKYEKLPRIKEQLEHLPEQEIYQSLRDGDYILLYDFEENRYSVCIAVNNKGEAWDIPLGDHGYKVKIPESGYVPYTVYDGNVTGAQQDDIFRDRKYIGKLIPATGESVPLKEQKDQTNSFKEFAAVAHEGLDLAGYVPGFGSATGAAETILYLVEGDDEQAAFSAITIIPGAKYVKAAKKLTDVPGVSRLIRTKKDVPARLPAGADKNLSPAGVALDENRSVNKVLEGAKPGNKTKGPTTQYEKTGGYGQAEKDFYSLDLEKGSVRDRTDEKGKRIKTGRLRDGRNVNVRENSTEGHPTLEIQSGKNRIKVRYNN